MTGPVLPLLLVALLALAAHLTVLVALGPRRAIGDEGEYLERGRWPDPHRPVLYLRVPLVPALFRFASLCSAQPENGLRFAGALLGALAVTLVALAGFLGGSLVAGLLGAGLMLLWVERLLLAAHLWPDTLLCVLHAAALCLLQLEPTPLVAGALGLVLALACLTRIEQLALGPGLLAVLVLAEPDRTGLSTLLLLAPTGLALTAWSAVAWRRYRIPLPDTTWLFNLRILDRQLDEDRRGAVAVERSIKALLREEGTRDAGGSLVRRLLRRPLGLLTSLLRRLAASFGPDTFVDARLLPPHGVAYPVLSVRSAGTWRLALRGSFPLLALPGLWAIGVSGTAPLWLLAAAPVLLALVVVHFRSRYRLVLMPWLALAAAQGALALPARPPSMADWGGLAAVLLLALALMRWPPIVEHPSQAGG